MNNFYSPPAEFLPSQPITTAAHDVINRVYRAWRCGTQDAIRCVTGFSVSQVAQSTSYLLAQGQLKKIGRVGYEEALVPRGKSPENQALYCSGGSFYSSSHGRYESSPIETNQGQKICRHAWEVMKTAAWISSFFSSLGADRLIYPESILRQFFHWDSSEASTNAGTFHTTIPDAWVVSGRLSYRLEVQLSKKSVARFEEVLNDASHNDHILYVSPSAEILRSLRKIAQTSRVGIVQQYNEEELLAWCNEFAVWNRVAPVQANPMRDHYSSRRFRALMLCRAGEHRNKRV